MKGSTPQRNISFFPVSRGLMALAVSADSWAVTRLAVRHRSDLAFPVPDQPVWLHIPVSSLKDHSRLPSGTHKFVAYFYFPEDYKLGAEKPFLEIIDHPLNVTTRAL